MAKPFGERELSVSMTFNKERMQKGDEAQKKMIKSMLYRKKASNVIGVSRRRRSL